MGLTLLLQGSTQTQHQNQNPVYNRLTNRKLNLSLFLLLLTFLSLTSKCSFLLMAQGRPICNKKLQAAGTTPTPLSTDTEKAAMAAAATMRERALIGSRPPRCDGRGCESCGHCVAVQMPVAPQLKSSPATSHSYHVSILRGEGGDLSNYKPMSWKCKCGNFIFNP